MQLIYKRVFGTTLLMTTVTIAIKLFGINKQELYGNRNFKQVEKILLFKDRPFTGTTVERFPNKEVYKTTQYSQGLKHGKMEEYGFTGVMKHRWNYVNGLKEGIQESWYLEGPKKYVKSYKNGRPHGKSQEWFLNGNVYRQRIFDEGIETANKVYYITKELHTNYVKKDGAIYGLKSGELCMDFPVDGER